jgi:3-methyladenine DNA glycosylase AlkD
MTYEQAMAALEEAGSEQTRKTYARHGIAEPMFGVSFAVLGKLQKQIKRDHELALKLWDSGNHDARVLATMIADPAKLTGEQLDARAAALGNSCVTDLFSKMVAASPLASQKARQWKSSAPEFTKAAGWCVIAQLAMSGSAFSDAELIALLKEIESTIHGSPNRARYAMNGALIAIGGARPALSEQAIAAAGRIGDIQVDHGDTACKTPDAAQYIRKMLARRGGKSKPASTAPSKSRPAVKSGSPRPATRRRARATS